MYSLFSRCDGTEADAKEYKKLEWHLEITGLKANSPPCMIRLSATVTKLCVDMFPKPWLSPPLTANPNPGNLSTYPMKGIVPAREAGVCGVLPPLPHFSENTHCGEHYHRGSSVLLCLSREGCKMQSWKWFSGLPLTLVSNAHTFNLQHNRSPE